MDRPNGYYWVKLDNNESRWHIAYHNQYGWTLSYEFSSPEEGWWTNDEVKEKFNKIIGPIKQPVERKDK
jgi:hypothetical protein